MEALRHRAQRGGPRKPAAPAGSDLSFRLLGPLEVRGRDGCELPLGAGRQRALLAVLLLHANETVSTDRLIDELWGERPPPTAAKIVQNRVARLRRALGNGHLVTAGHAYRLETSPGSLDRDRFETLVTEGSDALAAGDPQRAADRLREALALWRGAALEEFAYEAFARDEIARLEELRLAATEERVEADLALGLHAELVAELEDLIRKHPLRERLQRQLMLALYRSGRQADALSAYRDARARLKDELGLEPGDELQRLERDILTHDPGIAPAPHGARRPRRGGRSGRRLALWTVAALLVAAAIVVLVVQLTGGASPPRVVADSVALVDPSTTHVVGDVRVGSRPIAIASGAGSIWVANADDGTISRVDVRSREVVDTIGIGGAPASDIAFGAGSVWVVTGSDGRLVRIDPRTDTPMEPIPLGGPSKLAPHGAFAVAATRGAVWVGSASGRLLRVDPRTGHIASLDVGQTPTAIAASGDEVWVALADRETLRVDARTLDKTGYLAQPPSPISLAASGASLWVGGRSGELPGTGANALWRVDPASVDVARTTGLPGPPMGIDAGGGAVWVACADGTVVRADPQSGAIRETIRVGHLPLDVAYARGLAWVSIGGAGAI
ncbi:MAG TPA: BTAD domain-containing putative transcriptional regulator [Gaiellaceae bacterium]|nr:BTAD domain-containing putative transcriptional regulator [Gaiellaceae bacterium]